MMRSAMLMGLALLVVGCAGGPRRVSEGWLQKRQHRPGWHLDLDARSDLAVRRVTRLEHLDLRIPDLTMGKASCERHPLPSRMDPGSVIVMRASAASASRASAEVGAGDLLVRSVSTDQEDLMPRKRWNRLAVPAFVVSLGAVALALFTTSTIAVIAALVVAMVLAGISIRQIRWREEAGKGFAMAALMIAVIAAIVTAMVTAVVGFV